MKHETPTAFLTGPQTAKRYGITPLTLTRWWQHPTLGFPKPMVIRDRNYWQISSLEEWEIAQARTAAPA